jgi:hypothetical protein
MSYEEEDTCMSYEEEDTCGGRPCRLLCELRVVEGAGTLRCGRGRNPKVTPEMVSLSFVTHVCRRHSFFLSGSIRRGPFRH